MCIRDSLEEEYKKLSKGNSSGGGTVIIGGSGSQKVGGYNQVYVKVCLLYTSRCV